MAGKLLMSPLKPAKYPEKEQKISFPSISSSHRVTMGIKGLTKLLATHAPKCITEKNLESYRGQKIAIDTSICLFQFLIVIRGSDHGTLTNEYGKVTSHLQGMFYNTARLLRAGVKPAYVFDGQPPYLKSELLRERDSRSDEAINKLEKAIEIGDDAEIGKYSKWAVKVTKQHNEDCRKLLRLMGVPVIESPSEAEAECASLCKTGKVDAVASEDLDALAFGAPRFLRHFVTQGSKKIPVMEFNLSMALEQLNLNMDQFVDLCILCGCNYCDTIRGIGPQNSMKLIRQYGSIEKISENIDKDRFQIPTYWPYEEARCLFKEPQVTPEKLQPNLEWTTPNEEGLKKFLVDENSFNYDRVMKVIENLRSTITSSSSS